MSVTIDLSGQTALVTGASRGIGAAVARTLHRAGAAVIVNHPDQGQGQIRAEAEALVLELNSARPASAWPLAADVSDPEAVASMMNAIAAQHQKINVLVNNAGILRDRTVAKMSLDDWRSVIDVNLSGVFHCCKFGLELLAEGASVVNLGSLAASAGFHGQANYAAAKAGVQALTRVLSREWARRGIRVNAVAPGAIDTAMMASVSDNARAEIQGAIPLGRFGTPDEVAATVLFLCSSHASYITGATIAVNGGWYGV